MGLISVWDIKDIDYTHVHTDGKSLSKIDHFMISKGLVHLIEDSGPVHRGDNLSIHSPIFLTLKLTSLVYKPSKCTSTPLRYRAWEKASCDEIAFYTKSL